MRVILPVGIELRDWADALKSDYPTIPSLESDDGWRAWSDQVVSFGPFREKNAPRHDAFLTWRDWAYEFTQAVS